MPSAVAAAKVARRTPAQRRHQIDQPERKDRHQPQEQQIAEGVGAKALRQLLRQRPGPAHEMLAERAPGDQEDADRADGRAHQRRRPAEDGAEQDAADHGEIEPDRQRQRDRRDIERDIGRDRGHLVRRDEVAAAPRGGAPASRTRAAGASPWRRRRPTTTTISDQRHKRAAARISGVRALGGGSAVGGHGRSSAHDRGSAIGAGRPADADL